MAKTVHSLFQPPIAKTTSVITYKLSNEWLLTSLIHRTTLHPLTEHRDHPSHKRWLCVCMKIDTLQPLKCSFCKCVASLVYLQVTTLICTQSRGKTNCVSECCASGILSNLSNENEYKCFDEHSFTHVCKKRWRGTCVWHFVGACRSIEWSAQVRRTPCVAGTPCVARTTCVARPTCVARTGLNRLGA